MDRAYAKHLKGKTVTIVGPAPGMVGSKRGEKIDSFDVVVRLNKALPVPEDMTEDIGCRTDVLYHCLNRDPQCGGAIRFEHMKEIGLSFFCCPYPPLKVFQPDFLSFYRDNLSHQIPFHHMSGEDYEAVSSKVQCRPNTGFGAIYDLLQFDIKKLFITGFTFFKGGYYGKYKPWNEKEVMDFMAAYMNHDQDTQRAYMKEIYDEDDRVEADEELGDMLK